MQKHLLISFVMMCLGLQVAFSQNTVGLLNLKAGQTYAGYNLIYPHNQPNVYLLDECGELVHSWTDAENWRPGNTAYLLPDGNLVKTKRENNSINDPIWAGGGGAVVEILDWSNNLLYSYELNDSLYRLHHDIAVMPNSHVLMVVWEKKTVEEAIAAGRRPDLLPGGELWSEAVYEWDPFLDSIVWRWSLWDHLIQDLDASKNNYGVVGNHPELVDINYDEHDGHEDWLHLNAIDYHAGLDQIVLSVPYFNEVWVIDHSTATTEAASHAGGDAGRGGDLLFRWGNPATYDQGTAEDQTLFFQHGVNWVNPLGQPTDTSYSYIAVYNNRAPGDQSPGQIIAAELLADGVNYVLNGAVFAPEGVVRSVVYPGDEPRSNSASVSSVQFLPNGNTLLLSGRWGFAYEVNAAGELVWEYIIPIKNGSPAAQGDVLGISDNLAFRMDRYALDYPAFEGKDLSPKGYLELNANEGFCGFLSPAAEAFVWPQEVAVYPNPARQWLTIEAENYRQQHIRLLDMNGRMLRQLQLDGPLTQISTEGLAAGMYWLQMPGRGAKKIVITN